jgi:hypothetical protein
VDIYLRLTTVDVHDPRDADRGGRQQGPAAQAVSVDGGIYPR